MEMLVTYCIMLLLAVQFNGDSSEEIVVHISRPASH